MQNSSAYNYSVLMAVYSKDNSENLTLAIQSMLEQSSFPEQFVIVEDGELPQELENVILHYETTMPALFTIVRLAENKGLGNALNKGIEVCRNELIARMDADDISKRERCKKQLERFRCNSSLDILGTQIEEFVGDISNVVSRRTVPCNNEEIIKFARRRSPFNHPTVMYKKSSVQRVGGYKVYGRKEDLDLFVRMVNAGVVAENLEESLLFYRTSADNYKRRKTWINCKEYIQIMYGFYKKKYIGIVDLLYVVAGQMAMYCMPSFISKKLSKKYLRDGK